MPSYFCRVCHELIFLDDAVDTQTVVCEKCKRKNASPAENDAKKKAGGEEDNGKPAICPIADWK
jgi:hypothetical protein